MNLCLYCQAELSGRTDKKFCDVQCKNAYHNSLTNKEEEFIKSINKIIRRNRRILKYASPQGKTSLKKEFLDKLGFNFAYYTNHYKSKGGNNYCFCYDYGYLQLEDEKVLIINWQPYMTSK